MLNLYILQSYTDHNIFVPSVSIFLPLDLSLLTVYFDFVAKELDADFLIILTAVEKVALNYGKPDEKWLDDVTVEEAKQYVEEGHFAPGSMLPKVQAALDFAEITDHLSVRPSGSW